MAKVIIVDSNNDSANNLKTVVEKAIEEVSVQTFICDEICDRTISFHEKTAVMLINLFDKMGLELLKKKKCKIVILKLLSLLSLYRW